MAKKSVRTKKKKSKKTKQKRHTFRFLSFSSSWIYGFLCIALSFMLYASGISYDFILDDKVVITENEFTTSGVKGIWDHLTHDSFQGYFKEKKDLLVGGRYRPLSLIFFSVIYEFAGLSPVAYHTVNILLYGLLSFLIFYLLSGMLSASKQHKPVWTRISFLAALVFLFHPIHSEVVANCKGLDEILTMVFAITAWVMALRLYNTPKSWPSLVLMCVSFFLALLAKENALTYLAIIPLSIYVFGTFRKHHIWKICIPLLLVAIGYLILRTSILGYLLDSGREITDLMNNPFYGLHPGETLATIFYTWVKYLFLFIYPHPLAHDYYPYAIQIHTFGDIWVWISILLHIGLLVLGLIWGLRRRNIPGFSLLYYGLSFSIVSNLFFTIGTFMNERFLFMPSLGLALLLVWGIQKVSARFFGAKATAVTMGVIGLLLLLYSVKIWTRIPDWETHRTLNASAVSAYPSSARSNLFMGTALYNEAMEMTDAEKKLQTLNESMKWIERSIAVFPKYGNRVTKEYKFFNAYKMKAGIAGEVYKLNGDLDQLLDHFLEVVTNKPQVGYLYDFLDYLHRRQADPQKMEDFYHHAAFDVHLVEKRNPEFAMSLINKGLEYLPNSALLLYDKARTYQAAGDQLNYSTYLERARAIDPSIPR